MNPLDTLSMQIKERNAMFFRATWLNLTCPCLDLSALELLVLQVCRARKDIKPGNLIGPWRALLRLDGEMAHLTEWKWVCAEKGREKKSGKGAVEGKIRHVRLKEAGEGWQTGGGSEKELVRSLVKRLKGVTENKSCRRLRDRVEMKAAVKGTEGGMKIDWMGTREEKQKRKDEWW